MLYEDGLQDYGGGLSAGAAGSHRDHYGWAAHFSARADASIPYKHTRTQKHTREKGLCRRGRETKRLYLGYIQPGGTESRAIDEADRGMPRAIAPPARAPPPSHTHTGACMVRIPCVGTHTDTGAAIAFRGRLPARTRHRGVPQRSAGSDAGVCGLFFEGTARSCTVTRGSPARTEAHAWIVRSDGAVPFPDTRPHLPGVTACSACHMRVRVCVSL